ncbi:MAG TPA: TIGR03086 family metal-binding protein [Actinocatenispora sp.]
MTSAPPATPPPGTATTTLVQRAVQALIPLAARAHTSSAVPTPCEEYTVDQLGTHLMTVLNRGVRAGNGYNTATVLLGSWEAFEETAATLSTVWSSPAAWNGEADFYGSKQRRGFIGSVMVMELVVHGWDLARALDTPYMVEDDLVATSLAAARENDALGARDFGAFRPQRDSTQIGTIDHLIAFTGRDVHWTPPVPIYRACAQDPRLG